MDSTTAASVTWRSEAQKQSVLTCLRYETDGLFVLATGSGKTYVPIVPALIERNSLTIIATPLNAIFENTLLMLPPCNKIRMMPWTSDSTEIWDGTQIVLISYERAGQQEFKRALVSAYHAFGYHRVRLGLDECHMVETDGDWRPSLPLISELRALVPMQVVAYTGTLPRSMEGRAKQTIGLASGEGTSTIRTTTNRPELSFCVAPTVNSIKSAVASIVNMWQELRGLATFDPERHRAIIFVQSGDDGRQVKRELALLGYDSEMFCGSAAAGGEMLSLEERERILSRWEKGGGDRTSFLLATPALGAGYHYPWVKIVFHVRPADGILAQLQQCTRAGRDGKTSWCVILPFANDEHWRARGTPDVKGKNALMKLVFGKQKSCIRKSFFDFVDGPEEGQVCNDYDYNARCSNCVPGPFGFAQSLPPAAPESAPAPYMVSVQKGRKRAASQSFEDGRRPSPSTPGIDLFLEQQETAKSRKAGRLGYETSVWQDVKDAQDYWSAVCPPCTMSSPGKSAPPHAARDTCPHIQSGEESWKSFKFSIRYNAGPPYCYKCHGPLQEVLGHPTALQDLIKCKPLYPTVLQVAWFARTHPDWTQKLDDKFPDIARSSSYEDWLAERSSTKPWRNITDVFIWVGCQAVAATRLR